MLNYDILIESYEDVLKRKPEKCDVEAMKCSISAMKTLNGKSEEEVCALFNTGAFNGIVTGYCKTAMKNCELSEEQMEAVISELKWLFDTKGAKDVL